MLILKILTLPFIILPEKLSIKLGEYIGGLLYHLCRSRRLIAIDNVNKTLKFVQLETSLSPSEIIQVMFKNLGRYLAEILRIYWGDEKIFKKVRFHGLENFYKAKAQGKGVIFISGHCGNWELMAIAFGKFFEPVNVVARPIDITTINKFVENIRAMYGNKVIYKKGAVKEIIKNIRGNGIVGVLIDQSVLKEEGVLINFLGRPACTSKMPVLIAKKTGSKLLPVFIKREQDEYIIEIHEAIELTGDEIEDTRVASGYIERFIIENPSEWLWIHRRWKKR